MTISDEEHVARAIFAAAGYGYAWDTLQAYSKGSYCAQARAAIAAMREREGERNEWRETVRDIYDNLHFAKWDGLPAILVAMIEKRHYDFFVAEHELDVPPAAEITPMPMPYMHVDPPAILTQTGCLMSMVPDPAEAMREEIDWLKRAGSKQGQQIADSVGIEIEERVEAMRAKCFDVVAVELAAWREASHTDDGDLYAQAIAAFGVLKPISERIASLKGKP